jgi:hypothetical protein
MNARSEASYAFNAFLGLAVRIPAGARIRELPCRAPFTIEAVLTTLRERIAPATPL